MIPFAQTKPNVGHSEGASALTSLIKSVLCLEHRAIPPSARFETPNPKSKILVIFHLVPRILTSFQLQFHLRRRIFVWPRSFSRGPMIVTSE